MGPAQASVGMDRAPAAEWAAEDQSDFGGPWLVQLRSAVEGFLNCADSIRKDSGYEPAPGSTLALEYGEEAALAGDWGPRPVNQGASYGAIALFAAREHIKALDRLVDFPPITYSLAPVTRAAVEACARAWWLLDPEIGARGRVERGMTERLHGLWATSRLPDEVPRTVDTAGRIQSILVEAQSRGLHVVVCKGREAPAIGSRRPGSRRVVEELLDVRGLEWAGVAYHYLSAVSHAGADGLMQTMTRVKDSPGWGYQSTTLSDVGHFLAIPALAFATAFERELVLYGWDTEAWISWKVHAFQTIRSLLTMAPPPSA